MSAAMFLGATLLLTTLCTVYCTAAKSSVSRSGEWIGPSSEMARKQAEAIYRGGVRLGAFAALLFAGLLLALR